MDCTFCGLIREGITGWVARGPVACAFTPLNPLAPGHTLVVPTLHYADIFETPPEVLSVVTALVQRVAAATRTALNASGVNILSAHACTAREASDRLRPGPWHRTGTDVEGPNPCRGRAGGSAGGTPAGGRQDLQNAIGAGGGYEREQRPYLTHPGVVGVEMAFAGGQRPPGLLLRLLVAAQAVQGHGSCQLVRAGVGGVQLGRVAVGFGQGLLVTPLARQAVKQQLMHIVQQVPVGPGQVSAGDRLRFVMSAQRAQGLAHAHQRVRFQLQTSVAYMVRVSTRRTASASASAGRPSSISSPARMTRARSCSSRSSPVRCSSSAIRPSSCASTAAPRPWENAARAA